MIQVDDISGTIFVMVTSRLQLEHETSWTLFVMEEIINYTCFFEHTTDISLRPLSAVVPTKNRNESNT